MEHAFWHKRWSQNEIGFHQDQFNIWLRKHWRALGVSEDQGVLVPLCGKSRDMLWLREQGHAVVGVELSDLACRDFFYEQGVEVTAVTEGGYHIRERDGIRILCGDFMALQRVDLEGVRAIYDRAALIALPPEMRSIYADKLKSLTLEGDRMLLVTLEYDVSRERPPFAVFESEVRRLYEPAFTVELIDFENLPDPRFEGEREVVYRLIRQ